MFCSLRKGSEGLEEPRRVVVSRNCHDRTCATCREGHEAAEAYLEGVYRRKRAIEEVAAVHDEVDVLSVGDRHNLGNHFAVFGRAVVTAESFSHMPIGGVENPHGNVTASLKAGKGVDVTDIDLLLASRPRWERKLNDERNRNGRLGHNHGPGLQEPGSCPGRRKHPAVFCSLSLRSVEPACHPDCCILKHLRRHTRRRLLGSNQQNSE